MRMTCTRFARSFATLLCLSSICASGANADSPSDLGTYVGVVYSPSNLFFGVQVVTHRTSANPATGEVDYSGYFKVFSCKNGEMVWQSRFILGPIRDVFLADDGESLAVITSEIPSSTVDGSKSVAVTLYLRDRLLQTYDLQALGFDLACGISSASYLRVCNTVSAFSLWHESYPTTEEAIHDAFAMRRSRMNPRWDGDRMTLLMMDNLSRVFDITTGKLLQVGDKPNVVDRPRGDSLEGVPR